MEMDKAPLNRAHQLERKAETFNRQKKYNAAIDCHKEAVELFKQALNSGNNKTMNESIQLQKEWNERQIRLLEMKKSHAERKTNSGASSRTIQKETETLEAKIFQTIETHDSLIYYLSNRGAGNENKQVFSTIEEESAPQIVGNKHPKDEATIIEELKVLSGELRESVQGLLIQLDDRNKEIEMLKADIKRLELEKTSRDGEKKLNFETANSSGRTSPHATSLWEDSSPELTALPTLELEPLPSFDDSHLRDFFIPEVDPKFLRK